MTSFSNSSARSTPSVFTCATLVCLGLTFISPLWAQTTSSSDHGTSADSQPTPEPDMEQARAAFEKGRALMASQDWLGASAQFVVAAQIKNTPGIRYHIAFCEEKAGRMAEALQGYELARDLLKVSPAEDVAKLIPAAIERVRITLGAVVLQELPPGSSVTIDEKVYDPSEEIILSPGQHQLVITQDGYEPFEKQVKVTASGTEIVRVTLVPLSPGDATEVTPKSHPESAPKDGLRRGVFWSGVGLAITGAATGGVGAGIFFSAQSSINKSRQEIGGDVENRNPCVGATGELSEACADLNASEERKRVGTILLVAGGSALVVGGVSALVAEYFWPEAPVTVDVGLTQQAPTFGLRGRF